MSFPLVPRDVLDWESDDDDFFKAGNTGLMENIALELLGLSPVMKVLAPALSPVCLIFPAGSHVVCSLDEGF